MRRDPAHDGGEHPGFQSPTRSMHRRVVPDRSNTVHRHARDVSPHPMRTTSGATAGGLPRRANTTVLPRAAVVVGAGAVLAASWFVPVIWVLIASGAAIAILLTLRYPIAGLVLLIFSVPWAGGFSLPLGPFPLTLTDLVVGGLGVAWLVDAMLRRRSPITTAIWAPFLLLFLAAIALSVVEAADWHASVKEILKWVELVVVYFASVRFVTSRRDVHLLVAALVLAGVSQALLGYVQFLFGLGPEAFIEHRLFLRAYGTFDQPNPFAGYLNMEIPFALTMSVLAGTKAQRTLYALGLVTMIGAIAASQSRGAALAGLIAGAVVVGFLSRRLRPWLWIAALASACVAWLSSLGLVPIGPFERVLTAVGLGNVSFANVTNANFSAVERAAHWLAGARMFAAHPLLGVGIGNYGVAYPAYHPRGWYASLDHAHNYYINIAAEAGVIGLTTYLLVAGTALWYAYAAIRRSSDRLLFAVVLGVLGALIATDLHNLFDVLFVHGMVALLGLLVALIPISQCIGTESGD